MIWASLLLLPLVLPSTGLGRGPVGSGERIDDSAFWRMFSEFSEPNGYFHSDNLVSNERTFPSILNDVGGRAAEDTRSVGVGQEQNFSYLAALKPRVFCTSNVESYLFRGDDGQAVYDNLSALPTDSRSLLVRSVSGRGFFGGGSGYRGPGGLGNLQLDPIEDLVATFRRGEISSYESVVARR